MLKMKKILILLFISYVSFSDGSFNPLDKMKDVISGGAEIGKGVGSKIPELIPTPNVLLNAGKEVLLGYPFEIAATAINKLCSVASSANATKPKITPKFNEMKLVLLREKESVEYGMPDAEKMWSNSAFNKNWPTTIFITGWLTDLKHPRDKAIETMKKAYDARGKNNFIVLDSTGFVDTLYTWSAFNTEEIGVWVGKALAKLVSNYPIENIHVMGHSLGAHIAGSVGRSFELETGKLLKRVTGLDPANPCFNEGEGLHGLQRGDAEFIDVIHTNNNVLGKEVPVGDVDFYPNG